MLETSTGKVRRLNGQQCVWSSDLSCMDRQSSKACCCLTKFNNSPLVSRKSHYLPLNNISRYRFLWLLPSFCLLLSGFVICFQLLCELCEWAVSMFIFRWRGSRQSTSHWQNKIIDLLFRANRNKVNGFLLWTCYWYTGLGWAIIKYSWFPAKSWTLWSFKSTFYFVTEFPKDVRLVLWPLFVFAGIDRWIISLVEEWF